jgi:hypothetical protein
MPMDDAELDRIGQCVSVAYSFLFYGCQARDGDVAREAVMDARPDPVMLQEEIRSRF